MGEGVQNAGATKRMTDQPAPARMFLLKTFNLIFYCRLAEGGTLFDVTGTAVTFRLAGLWVFS